MSNPRVPQNAERQQVIVAEFLELLDDYVARRYPAAPAGVAR